MWKYCNTFSKKECHIEWYVARLGHPTKLTKVEENLRKRTTPQTKYVHGKKVKHVVLMFLYKHVLYVFHSFLFDQFIYLHELINYLFITLSNHLYSYLGSVCNFYWRGIIIFFFQNYPSHFLFFKGNHNYLLLIENIILLL